MSAMASQITDASIVCSTICSGADQRKHQSSATLAFMCGIHWWPPRGYPAKRASDAENASIWWLLHGVVGCGGYFVVEMCVYIVCFPFLTCWFPSSSKSLLTSPEDCCINISVIWKSCLMPSKKPFIDTLHHYQRKFIIDSYAF